MNRWTVLFAAIMFSMFVAIGCSGGGGSPVAPSAGPEITSGSDNSGQIQNPNTSLLGYFDVYLDVGNQTMEVVEDRTAAYTINIVPFLNQMASPQYGISLGNIDFDDTDPSNLLVDVEFKWYHPFPTIPQYKVYDFMGVIISNGDMTLGYHNLRVGNYGSDTFMTNADGYTRWFNPSEFTTEQIFGWAPGGIQNLKGSARLNPFKAYGRGLHANGSLWDWLEGTNYDGVFQPGDDRLMSLEFPMPTDGLVFGYAAVCCWEEQGAGPYTPYHRDEPIAFRVTVEDNVYYDGASSGGDLIADIDIWAWGDQPVEVQVESTVLSGIETAAPTGGGGANWSTYSIDVTSKPITSNDGHEMWVIAECDGDYINVSGVPAPPSSEPLTAFYRVPLFIATEPYNICPIIDSGVDGNATPSKVALETYSIVAHDLDPLDTLTYSWTVTDNSSGLPAPGYDGVPGDGAGNLDVDWLALGVGIGDTFDVDCDADDGMCATPADTLLATISNADPICDLIVVTSMPHVGKGWIEFDASGSSDPDGDPLTFEWDFDDDGTFGDPYDSGTDDNPTKNWDSDYVGQVCVKVTDGLGGEAICCEDVDITALMEINVVGDPNKTILGTGKDIAIDPTSDRVAINYAGSTTWRRYTNNYGTVATYGGGWRSSYWDWQSWGCMYGGDLFGSGHYPVWSWRNWSGGSYGGWWFGSDFNGMKDECNLQNTNHVWGIFDMNPSRAYFLRSTAINNYSFPYSVSGGWYNGTGNNGVVMANIIGIDMKVYTSGYQMYFLEDLPASNTAVVERYNLASTPTHQISFGEDFLYDALDITVDSDDYIYVLEEDSNGDPVIWAFDDSGILVGTSEALTATEISGDPLRIDAFLSSDPDEVHVLHTGGVTEFAMQ